MAVAVSVGRPGQEELGYSEFLARAEAGDVAEVTINRSTGAADGTFDDGEAFHTVVPPDEQQSDLVDELRDGDASIRYVSGEGDLLDVLVGLLPFLLLIGVMVWLFRRARGQFSQMSSLGRSKAKLLRSERPTTRFDDVAGYANVKREVAEIVDYLEDPGAFKRVGARGPGGLLLVGPPGTGKTMLARAVAGEAEVPFLSATGSEFVEMLVGVGASRVRDLFEQARQNAPSIVFIDELDSIGRSRGGAQNIGSHNEQEQTLNQLLAEMDGFDPSSGVVVMAATNRPEMLDAALLRPGRFDREIAIPAPVRHDRREILEVHVRGKPTTGDLDLDVVARGTPGFSGADLENLVNEAAINAVREERDTITQDDFAAARDRILLGQRERTDVLRPEELRRVAVHEGGHAVMAVLSDEADPVEKVTILPTRRALGVTHQLPLDDRRLQSEAYLHDVLAVRLGGRAAELVVLDEGSTGAAHDLTGATELAARMVGEFGLSPKLGPVGYSREGEPNPLASRPYAEETQRLIDEEVARLLREAEQRALDTIANNRATVDELVELLLEEETVDGQRIYELFDRKMPR